MADSAKLAPKSRSWHYPTTNTNAYCVVAVAPQSPFHIASVLYVCRGDDGDDFEFKHFVTQRGEQDAVRMAESWIKSNLFPSWYEPVLLPEGRSLLPGPNQPRVRRPRP